MIDKAILATDFSQAADLLIQCSDSYKDLGIKKITLFHALGVEYMNFYGYVDLERTKEKLERLKQTLSEKGFKVDIVIKEGLPYFELEEYSKAKTDSLIIIGTKGKGFLKGLALGSTVNHIIKAATIPILIVQCNENPEDPNPFSPELICNSSSQHILFPTDFSETSGKAFQLLLKNIAPASKKISLLHVQDSEVMKYREVAATEEFNKIDLERLEDLKNELQKNSTATINIKVLTGNPTIEILKFIQEEECSLVVLGKQGRGFISEYIVGSVTRRLIDESKVNCLIVPNS